MSVTFLTNKDEERIVDDLERKIKEANSSSGVTEEEINKMGFLKEIPDEFITEDELEEKMKDLPSSSESSIERLILSTEYPISSTYDQYIDVYHPENSNILSAFNKVLNNEPVDIILRLDESDRVNEYRATFAHAYDYDVKKFKIGFEVYNDYSKEKFSIVATIEGEFIRDGYTVNTHVGTFEVKTFNRGTGILKVTSSPSNYKIETGGKVPIKRMALSTIIEESGLENVLVGDIIESSYYHYHVYYVDSDYAYIDTSTPIRGAEGLPGEDYVLTEEDKVEIAGIVEENVSVNIPAKTSDLQNDSGFITKEDIPEVEIPDLTGYATETYVQNKIAEAQLEGEEIDLSGYATKDDLKGYAKTSDIPTDYAKADHKHSEYLTEHQSLTGYAKTADHYTKTESDNKYQPKGNYLTEHQSLEDYAKKTDIPTDYATKSHTHEEYLTEVSGDYVKNTDYATNAKAGVVKVGGESAGVKLNADNILVVASAGTSEINQKASANRPITPYYLDYAIRKGLSDNELEWTEEQKSNSRKAIGASSDEIETAFDKFHDTLLWDGSTEGLEIFDMMGDGSYTYYRVSDLCPSLTDLANGVTITIDGETVGEKETLTIKDYVNYHDVLISQGVSSVIFATQDNVSFYGSVITKKGTYFMASNVYGRVYKMTIPGYTGFSSHLILKEEHLPKEYASKDDDLTILCDYTFNKDNCKTLHLAEGNRVKDVFLRSVRNIPVNIRLRNIEWGEVVDADCILADGEDVMLLISFNVSAYPNGEKFNVTVKISGNELKNGYTGTLSNVTIEEHATKEEVSKLENTIADHKDDTAVHVTSTEKQAWNNKSNFSGKYADLSGKPTIPSKASDVGADPSGTAESKVSSHNTSETSHNDIRLLIEGLTNRLNALANSDDTTLDQMAEVVAYIKNNKSLIDGITTSKVNVSDIIDNLTTSVSNKPLSAKQGVQLKALIDKCLTSIPSEYITESELNAKGYLTSHQDISGKADKSNAETWTFTLEDGSTVTKKVVLA